MNTTPSYDETLERGIELFNEGKFFEAHAVWEPLWLCAEEPRDKQFLQGLIMASGALLHYLRRECSGALTLLEKSRHALEGGASLHTEIRLADFLQALDRLRDRFAHSGCDVAPVELPRIATYGRPCVQRQVY